MSERKTVRERVGWRLFGDFSYGEEATLAELRAELDDAIAKYGADAYVHQDTECGDCCEPVANLDLGIWRERPETDAELRKRLFAEENAKKQQELRDRVEFERLSAKFLVRTEVRTSAPDEPVSDGE